MTITAWPVVRVGDVAEVKGGKRLPKGTALQTLNNGAPYIRITDWSNGCIDPTGLMFVPESAQPIINRYRIYQGDVFISIVGTVGLIADIPPSLSGAFLTENAAKISPVAEQLNATFLKHALSAGTGQSAIAAQSVGSTQPKLALHRIKDIMIPLPPVEVQRAIADVLGALDDKIAANTKLSNTSARLAQATFAQAVAASSDEITLLEVAELLSRGITPSYSEGAETTPVLNQKCIRDLRVDPSLARRTSNKKVRPEKLLRSDDVLVNSTGQGTLGRVARWIRSDVATVDSHVTIVRFDKTSVDPVCAGFAMLAMQDTIIQMGEGSTGQTELSRIELGKLRVKVPPVRDQPELGHRLSAMAQMESVYLDQNIALGSTRDALLPLLMSGKLRVKDAADVVGSLV